MAKQKGLGKGLGALLSDYTAPQQEESALRQLPLQKVEPNPYQPRRDFDPVALEELAESVAEHGILQPLTVRELPNGYYQIIAGERRWRAARMANLQTIPAIVIEADDRKTMELALIENLQRQDLNPVEEARGYKSLLEDYQLTQEEAARRVGKSRSAVANALRLLNLEEDILDALSGGRLTAGHARAILSVTDTAKRREAAQKVMALDLSVRQTELMCRNLNKEEKPQEEEPKLKVNYVAECEKTLSRHLGRGVKIVSGKRKGKFELEFYGPEDLQNLYEALCTLPKEVGKK
ncbi:MAG: ParB/RepB/Spo0J family partition protein [Ruminococcaceae bacterium]|nr:ParB/RepB/Spo0J family partition protein [Oscillospiraceae bacterium]